jgi:hypothetical protein
MAADLVPWLRAATDMTSTGKELTYALPFGLAYECHRLKHNIRCRHGVENEEDESSTSNDVITGTPFRWGISSLTGYEIFMDALSLAI